MALTTDPLFVGCTRPTMVLGVTFEAFIANGMVTAILFLGTGSLLSLLFCIPIHGVCYGVCATEPRRFELLNLWSKTKGRNMNRRIWNSSSYSPFEAFREPPVKAEKKTQ